MITSCDGAQTRRHRVGIEDQDAAGRGRLRALRVGPRAFGGDEDVLRRQGAVEDQRGVDQAGRRRLVARREGERELAAGRRRGGADRGRRLDRDQHLVRHLDRRRGVGVGRAGHVARVGGRGRIGRGRNDRDRRRRLQRVVADADRDLAVARGDAARHRAERRAGGSGLVAPPPPPQPVLATASAAATARAPRRSSIEVEDEGASGFMPVSLFGEPQGAGRDAEVRAGAGRARHVAARRSARCRAELVLALGRWRPARSAGRCCRPRAP